MHVTVDVDSKIAGVNCTLTCSRFSWEVFTSMRFLLVGYGVVVVLELALWAYGIEQNALSVTLQVWLGGGALGLIFAWRWFTTTNHQQDRQDDHVNDTPLKHPQDPIGRGISVARNRL